MTLLLELQTLDSDPASPVAIYTWKCSLNNN